MNIKIDLKNKLQDYKGFYCPYCQHKFYDYNNLHWNYNWGKVRACQPNNKFGFFKCNLSDNHLHWECNNCNAKWITQFKLNKLNFVEKQHVCPICGVFSNNFINKGCSTHQKYKYSFFKRCNLGGDHLHQQCKTCLGQWTSNANFSLLNDASYLEIDKHFNKMWFKTGSKLEEKKFHRKDGPAIELANGDKHWYINGKLHREDGPAIKYANGEKHWYLSGKLYSENEYLEKIKLLNANH